MVERKGEFEIGGKMPNEEIRAKILKAAFEAAEEAGGIKVGIFNVYEISKGWGVEEKRIDFNADYLNEAGLVIWAESGGGMRITATGVEEYERTRNSE